MRGELQLLRLASVSLDLSSGLRHDIQVRRWCLWSLGVVVLTWTSAVHSASPQQTPADEPIDLTESQPMPAPPMEPSSWLNEPAKRRCGFALGLQLGPVLGAARGYPLDALKIDREEFLHEGGFGGGGQLGVYFGIALADWFVVGLGPSAGRIMNGSDTSAFFSMSFHIDAFPAFDLGGAWQDLGVMVDAGLAGLQTTDDHDTELTYIDSGLGSRLAFGVVWEGVRAWKLSMGPFAAADMMWSPSVFRPAAWLGWRTTFYGGP